MKFTKISTKISLLALGIAACTTTCMPSTSAKPQNVYSQIRTDFKTQCAHTSLKDKVKMFFESKEQEKLKGMPKELIEELVEEREGKFCLLMDLMPKKDLSTSGNSARLPYASWGDQRIVTGDPQSATSSLANISDRTQTRCGMLRHKEFWVTPKNKNKVSDLIKRQNIIRTLVEQPDLHKKIQNNLSRISKSELTLLKFFSPDAENGTGPLGSGRNYYWDKGFSSLLVPQSIANRMNRNTTAMQTTQIVRSMWDFAKFPMGIAWGAHIYFYLISKSAPEGYQIPFPNPISPWIQMGKTTRTFVQNLPELPPVSEIAEAAWKGIKAAPKSMRDYPHIWAGAGMMGAIGAYAFYQVFVNPLRTSLKNLKALTGPAQKELSTIQCLIETVDEMQDTIGDEMGQNLESFEELQRFVNGELSTDLDDLLQTLEWSTFKKGKKQSIWDNQGRILKAYKLLSDIREQFAVLLKSIGEIDALSSAATLYKEHAGKKNGFCFVKYEDSDTPHVKINDMWNLFMEPNNAIPNSLELGAGKKFARHAIVSGPNAGGKSVYLTGAIAATIMGQAFGIAPATEMSFTPFANFDTYMNIEDSPGEGKSLFQKQIQRTREVLDGLNEVTNGGFSFIIADEMFTGTNPDAATKMGIKILERLQERPDCIGLVCTHFPGVAKAAESGLGGLFKNYHFEATRDNNGKLLGFPYLIKPGFTTDSNAMDMFEQAGLATT